MINRRNWVLFALYTCLTGMIGSPEVFGQVDSIELSYGVNPVGFQHYVAVDSSRRYQRIYDWTKDVGFREIPISVWYPGEADREGEPLRYLDYLRILANEEEWKHLPDEQILNWFYYANTPANREKLQYPTHAVKGLPRADGDFPVIVYAPGYELSSVENFALCEYLASHGYVVLSSPSRGTTTRFLDGGGFRDIETQTRDLEFLVGEWSARSGKGPEEVYTIGFSFGGLAAVYAQQRNDYVRGVISLDGAIKYQYEKIKRSPYFDPASFDVPFVHFSQKDIPEEVLREDGIPLDINRKFTFFQEIGDVEARNFRCERLTHSYLTALGVLFETRDPRQDADDADIRDGYALLCRYVKAALDDMVYHTSALDRLVAEQPIGGRITPIDRIRRKPKERRYDFTDFNDLAATNDYRELDSLYRSFRAKDETFRLEEGKLNNLGLQLGFNPDRYFAGVAVFRLAVRLYPQSSNLYDSLGEVQLYYGDREAAKRSFTTSLRLNENNQNAAARLIELED